MIGIRDAIDLVAESVHGWLRTTALRGKNRRQVLFRTILFIKGGSKIKPPNRGPAAAIGS
jgi:hypothetical protein